MLVNHESNQFNPIPYVDGKHCPCPSAYSPTVSDVSAPDAGRTEDGTMHKMKIGEMLKLEMTWNYIDTETLSYLQRLFSGEYFTVQYLDPRTGKIETSEFYGGDRASPLYNMRRNLWSNFSVNLIERRLK